MKRTVHQFAAWKRSAVCALVLSWAGLGALSSQVVWSNRVEVEGAFQPDGEVYQKGEVVWEPRIQAPLGRHCSATFEARLRADTEDIIEPGVPDQRTRSAANERWFIGTQIDSAVREAWVRCASGGFQIDVGKQQTVWGKADGLKLLDVVNPQSFREFILDDFADSRIPLWTVSASYSFGPSSLQVLWIPDTTYHELPASGSPFAFTSPLLAPRVSTAVPVELLAVSKPGDAFDDADWGARFATFLGGWDLSAVYLHHYDDLPVFRQQVVADGLGSRVVVEPTYERTDLYGGSFSNAFGKLTVRGEIGLSDDKAFTSNDLFHARSDSFGLVRSDELGWVLGLDWYGMPQSMLSFQYFESRVDDDLPLDRETVERNVTGFYRWWSRSEKLEARLMWMHNLERNDGLVRPEVRYQWLDMTRLWIGYDHFYGTRLGLFGQFRDQSRLRMGLGLQW